VWCTVAPHAPTADLDDGFRSPPSATKPWIYWYWINDNISRDGLTRDLEAMARVGIGEAFIGNVDLPGGQPRGKVPVFSDEWWGLVEHAIREGGRLGVDIGLFNCPGWSQSGGPWVEPTDAMRYVVISETRVQGPRRFEGRLALPAAASADTFEDIAVLALPAPKADADTVAARSPRVSCSSHAENAAHMVDGNVATTATFPHGTGVGKPFAIDIELATPLTARSLVLHPRRKSMRANCRLEAADENGVFRLVRSFLLDRSNANPTVGPMTFGPVAVSFDAVTSKRFRLVLTGVGGQAGIAEIDLSGAARLESFVEKQLGKMLQTPFAEWDTYLWPRQNEPEAADLMVSPDAIVDISDRMSADGTLRWDAPAGDWVILRVGTSPTGVTNNPTSPEGQGLEIDKMSRGAARRHFDAFVGKLLGRMPKADRKAFRHVVADSYETGSQNWTDGFAAKFRKRYGYDPTPWLPVLTGRIVGSAERSDRFLWDVRRLIADLIATEYVGGLRDLCHEHGLRLWLENYGHWGYPAEFLQYGGQSDEIGGEFWNAGRLGAVEVRDASSAAHIYGMPIVHCEAFTTGGPLWREHPARLKARGDWALCEGANHFVLHVWVHQPWEDRRPGMCAWFGTEFNRHCTWFEPSRAWIDYLRRCFFLLQQGANVADVAYFIGEDTPKMTGVRRPKLPPGYAFDWINAEVICERMRVEDGRFVLPGGASYRVIVLPELDTMRPETLRKIGALVEAGGVIVGPSPSRSPSLESWPTCDAEVKRLAERIWAGCDGERVRSVRRGKGRVFCGVELDTVFAQIATPPDVAVTKRSAGSGLDGLLWVHRATDDVDLYFVSNQRAEAIDLEVEFRVRDKAPELWNAVTGEIVGTARFTSGANGTRVRFALEPNGSLFCVFRGSARKAQSVVRVTRDGEPESVRVIRRGDGEGLEVEVEAGGDYVVERADGSTRSFFHRAPALRTFSGPWRVSFPAGVDPARDETFDRLLSWTEHEDPIVRHFSGTATYRQTFDFLSDPGERWLLDLGRVEVIAEVVLNGKNIGTVWKTPFTVDATDALRRRGNTLEIRVTNPWRNRLLGPRPSESTVPVPYQLWTSLKPNVQSDQPPDPAGLIGPVRLRATKRVVVE